MCFPTQLNCKPIHGFVAIELKNFHLTQSARLTPLITPTKAAELYEAFIADTISNTLKLKCDMITIAYSPSYAEKTFQRLCGQSVDYLPQKGDGLGERMKNAFKHSFDKGFERTIIIGTDSPTLPLSYIQKAFDVLKEIPEKTLRSL